MAFSKEDAVARQKAIDAGKGTYTRSSDGKRYTIRNLNNPRWSQNYGGQGGRDETSSARKANRGGGADGSRAINEKLATPDGADRKAFGKAMADANAKGMDGDHIQEISRTAEGIRFKESSGRGTRAQYHQNMADAGVSVGNQSTNVQPLPPDINQRVKPAQLRAMDSGIKNAQGTFKGLDLSKGAAKMKFGLSMISEFLPAIDEITGGHLTGATPEKSVAELNDKIANAKAATSQKGRMCVMNGAVCLRDFGVSELIGLNTRSEAP